MNKFSDEQIIDSWHINASPWISAIRDGEVESRLLVTNATIIETTLESGSKSVLDVGCGEGWLVRELDKRGVPSLGIDVVPEFIASAKKEGGGRFKNISYEKLSYEALNERFDAVVCNFSLLGNESVTHIFEQASSLLNEAGSLIVQTIHPFVASEGEKYTDGWREGSWLGFNDKFSNPAPWYFRTMETWKTIFKNNGFRLIRTIEPSNIKSNTPASVIFVGVKNS